MKFIFCILILLLLITLMRLFYEINFFSINFDLNDNEKSLYFFSLFNKNDGTTSLDENIYEKFRLNHKNMIDNKTKPIRVSINGYTNEGYANKMYSVLTSMVIAILTDSALIIRWQYIDKYIKEPFENSFKNFDSEKSELSANYKPENLFTPKSKYAWKFPKDFDGLIKTELPKNATRFLYNTISPYFFELCSNPIYFNRLLSYNLVRKKTINQALDVIYMYNSTNKTSQKNAGILAKIGFEVGGNLLNKMWIPKENVLDLIEYYRENYFKNNYVIGIQIRQLYINENDDLNVFIDCALEIEKKTKKTSNKKVKWFISTDAGSIIDKLLSLHSKEKIIVANGTIGHVKDNQDAYMRTIIDNHLLSLTDQIILTSGSTFGFLASMRQLKMPYYVNGKRGVKKCQKYTFNDPSTTPSGHNMFK